MRFYPSDFLRELDLACERRRDTGEVSALLLIGIGRLDFVNWNLGFGGGDAVLDAVAARLGDVLPPSPRCEPWPGKFAALVPCADTAEAMNFAHRVVATGSVPYAVEGNALFAPPYVGVVMVEPGYRGGAELLRDALFAMEDARTHVLGNTRLYNPDHKARIESAFRMETALREGFETGDQFSVAFQPLVAIEAEGVRLSGFEALARWTHPTLGSVPPDRFIPVAEEAGLIIGLGNFVLWEACRQQVEWSRHSARPVAMNVNLSPIQLQAPGIEDTIAEAIAVTGIDPALLKLEITETVLARDIPNLGEKLDRLRRTGVSIGIDDFGSGYSSLGQLDRFGLDFMKIDKGLIQRLGPEARQTELVRLTIGLAKHLGMTVVAEGIEDADQLRILSALGVDIGQGFYFSKPLQPALAAAWLREGYWTPQPQVMSAGTTARSNSSALT